MSTSGFEFEMSVVHSLNALDSYDPPMKPACFVVNTCQVNNVRSMTSGRECSVLELRTGGARFKMYVAMHVAELSAPHGLRCTMQQYCCLPWCVR
jgi:hypothetical protein